MKVYIVSGNIGAGKTTLLRHIAALAEADANRDVFVIYEDVDKWAYYLKKFYENADEGAFLFHCDVFAHYHAVTKKLHQIRDTNPNAVVFVERSPHDVLDVFLVKVEVHLDRHQGKGLHHVFSALCDIDVWESAEFIYVDTPAHLCYERKEKRSRDGEAPVDAKYLEEIEELYHDSWMIEDSIYTLTNDGKVGTLQECAEELLATYAEQ